jgi:hypothetical protein
VSGDRVNDLWKSVDDLVDRAPTAADLVAHRLFMHAVRRYRALGRPLPHVLAALEVQTAARMLALEPFLERLRNASTAPLLVLKGPEIAFRYPDPVLRPFTDVDVLTPDAHAVRDELISAGFFEVGAAEKYAGIHHLRPLAFGALPLVVELHNAPKWIDRNPPAVADLFSLAVPAALPIDGFLALPPGPHGLIVAAHAWAHTPLRRVSDLLDVEVLLETGDARRAADQLAGPWGMARVWAATTDAADAVLRGGRLPLTMRTWARNVRLVRDRSVLENHLERWVSCWWELPSRRAAVARTAEQIARDLTPSPGERWRTKLRRTLRALRHAGTRRGEHDHALRREASSRQD